MIGSELIMIIRDSARKGKSAYAIGKEQNISKNTAKKYMQVGVLPEPTHKRGSILDSFKSQVNQMMQDGILIVSSSWRLCSRWVTPVGRPSSRTMYMPFVHQRQSRLCHGMEPSPADKLRWIGESATIWAPMANSTKFRFLS